MCNLTVSFHSDQGLRHNMEDVGRAFAVHSVAPRSCHAAALLVCDGAGGPQAGEVAASCGAEVIGWHLAGTLSTVTDDNMNGERRVLDGLRQALHRANQAVVSRAKDSPELAGMASTAVAAVVLGGKVLTCWAGDSSCLLLHDGRIHRLTHGHGPVQRLIDAGQIPAEEALSHPLAHVIDQYLGKENGFEPETVVSPLAPGDIVVLGSDGLTDVLSDRQIGQSVERNLRRGDDFDMLAHQLVQEAMAAGTTDNTTVLCARYQPVVPGPRQDLNRTVVASYSLARFVFTHKERCYAERLTITCAETSGRIRR